MVSNSLCDHTGAVIFHNRVQHGSFLCRCSGWDKWNLQRIQDEFPQCHFISIITSVSSQSHGHRWQSQSAKPCRKGLSLCLTQPWPQLQINTFPQLWSLVQTFLQCCDKDTQGTLCHNARTCTSRALWHWNRSNDALVAQYSEHQNHRSSRGAGYTQQNKQITAAAAYTVTYLCFFSATKPYEAVAVELFLHLFCW